MAKETKKKEKPAPPKRPTGYANLIEMAIEAYGSQYVIYEVEARIRHKMAGGVPKRMELTFAMIDSRVKMGRLTEDEGERIKDEVRALYKQMADIVRKEKAEQAVKDGKEVDPEAMDTSQAALEANWNTFWMDEKGFYIEPRTIKAAIRECMSTLALFTAANRKKRGHNDGSFVEALDGNLDRIYLMRNGQHITKPDDYEDRVVLLKTAKGPVSALKRIDVIYGDEANTYDEAGNKITDYECTFGFRIKVLRDCTITEEDLVKAVTLLMDRGIGAMTSQGMGKWQPVRFERLGEDGKEATA